MIEPAYAGDGLTIYGGDCRDVLRELPAKLGTGWRWKTVDRQDDGRFVVTFTKEAPERSATLAPEAGDRIEEDSAR